MKTKSEILADLNVTTETVHHTYSYMYGSAIIAMDKYAQELTQSKEARIADLEEVIRGKEALTKSLVEELDRVKKISTARAEKLGLAVATTDSDKEARIRELEKEVAAAYVNGYEHGRGGLLNTDLNAKITTLKALLVRAKELLPEVKWGVSFKNIEQVDALLSDIENSLKQ